ncbi:exocyst complex component 3-like protein isoform X1 [Python bivittatus]|uniref:Exocyst complex component 3-like protein isoform X1 n=2 Tax=Python bivittatus TaxID=176946 RepID=A0A9F2N1T1_PYTBI|nr:exocyst complex component 3-like protein isoform X1 [Python bivittatus]
MRARLLWSKASRGIDAQSCFVLLHLHSLRMKLTGRFAVFPAFLFQHPECICCSVTEQAPEELGIGSLTETVITASASSAQPSPVLSFEPVSPAATETMGMSSEDNGSTSPRDGEWPELEKAEKLARGAALKWASGVFYRPDKLGGLGQYQIRERQRNRFIQSRIKCTLQSYLEGMSTGLEELHSALADAQHVQQELGNVQKELASCIDSFRSLQQLRELAVKHTQLEAVVQMLPQLFSVPQLLSEAFNLLQSQHLLKAHLGLMDLESLRDNILSQLYSRSLLSPLHLASVESYFGGLLELNDALAQHLWDTVAHATKVVSEDPSLFVSALRIIEREEGIDAIVLLRSQPHGFLPPGRPKCWRRKFFQVIQDTVIAAYFQAEPNNTQGQWLTSHLASLQSNILAELRIVKDLMVQCCPPHYNILTAFATMFHQGLANHLHHILTWDLDKQEIFALLHWAIHVYPSSEMMAHADLLPEVDISTLGPLLPADTIGYLEETYLGKVQASIAEWMQKALEMEFKEWLCEKEPESDYRGFFQTNLPIIAMQMLDENIRVASLISGIFQQKVLEMALGELEVFLGSLYEKLVEFCKVPQQEPRVSECYTPYLLSTVNNCLALSSSISVLFVNGVPSEEPARMLPSLHAALEKIQKKACQLLLEEMLADLKPLFVQLPSHQWLLGDVQPMNSICEVIDKHAEGFCRTHKHVSMYLLSEAEHLVMIQYVTSLLQKRMMCRTAKERSKMSTRMLQDTSQLKELFRALGLEEDKLTLKVIADLQQLISVKDPSMLGLEVLGFMSKYPDISEDHISMFLYSRGDISKEICNNVLEIMVQNPQVLPENYDPIFSNILVPAPELPFCFSKSKCA